MPVDASEEGADLVRVVELLHREAALDGAHDDEVALAARGVLRERPAAGLFERFAQELVGAVAAFVGREVERFLEVDRIDRFARHELADLDRLRRLLFHRLQLVLGEEDVLAARELVSLDDLGAVDGPLVFRAEELLLDAIAAILVDHVEADPLRRLGGGEHLHRDRHETEGDLR